MTLSAGDRLPEATVQRMGPNGPENVQMSELTRGRKVVLFGLPGAYTGTCTTSHVPSFIRTRKAFADKGVDEVICLSVNDAFVMRAWGEVTGATAAGITMIADPVSAFTKGAGLQFSVEPLGFIDRSKRYALYAEDGVVKVMHLEANAGQCDISGGESLLADI